MTEFEKAVMEEFRSLRKEIKIDINAIHGKIDIVEDKVAKVTDGLSLFKGKVFGVWAVLTVLFNVGMAYFTKK